MNQGKTMWVPFLQPTDSSQPFLFDVKGKGLIARGTISTIKEDESGTAALHLMAATFSSCGPMKATHKSLNVLCINTQKDYEALRQQAKAVLALTALSSMPDSLHIVPLLPYNIEDRAELLQKAVEICSPDLLIIDSPAGLCNQEQPKMFRAIAQLQQLALQGCAVVAVLPTEAKASQLAALLQPKSAEAYQLQATAEKAAYRQIFSRFYEETLPPFTLPLNP